MRGLFPQFDCGGAADFKSIWEDAHFVFDTNVLLNLYRYRAATRDQLIDVLNKLSDRIWIPHHVALEFQRNRIKVISDQNKRFLEVRAVVDKARNSLVSDLNSLQLERRHSLIDPEPLISGFTKVSDDFLSILAEIQQSQQKLTSRDPLKEKIEALFEGRVGPAPSDQRNLDTLYKAAENRYSREIPPGYMDSVKDKDGPSEYAHGELIYNRRYGDYIVWRQVLDYAKSEKINNLIFVTDNSKEDWWWVVKSDGPKTIGPRPELSEEARRIGGVSTFLMYKPEGFLSYSNDFLAANVSNETLQEVRDVSRVRSNRSKPFHEYLINVEVAEKAVLKWLRHRFSEVVENINSFPDFIAHEGGRTFGFEVRIVRSTTSAIIRGKDIAYRAHYEISEGHFDIITLIWIVGDEEDPEDLFQRMGRMEFRGFPKRVRNLIGVLAPNKEGDINFEPLHEFAFDDVPTERDLFSDLSR